MSESPIRTVETPDEHRYLGDGGAFEKTSYGGSKTSSANDIPEELISTSDQAGIVSLGKTTRDWFSVEVFQFIYLIGVYGTAVSGHQVYLDKSCRLIMNYSQEICNNLTEEAHPAELNIVQIHGNNYSMYVTLVGLLPASVMSIFISNWSDKYGRKLPMILAVSGILILDIGFLINGIYQDLPLYTIVLFGIPSGLFGGYLTINTSVYSLTSEKASPETRTFRHAVMEVILLTSIPLGTFIGGQLINVNGVKYVPVFVFVVLVHVLCILYAALALSETKTLETSKFREAVGFFFSFKNLNDSFKTCLQRRENYGRSQIWLLITSMCVTSMGYTVPTDQILYYFCNKVYTWNAKQYSNVFTIISSVTIVTLSISTYVFTRRFHVQDAVLGILGSVSLIAQNTCRAFATEAWLFYTSAAVGVFGGFSDVVVRSMISKLVPDVEINRVFMLYSFFVCTTPVVGSVAANQIYNASVAFFPGLYFILAASWLIFPLGVFILINRLKISRS